jgi:quercetin dioxygenase-like cupin family protein
VGRSTPARARVVRAAAGESFLASGSDTGGRFDMMVLDVGHLQGPPLHVHDVQEDSFYVLEGVVTVQIGDEVLDLEPGDFATAPPGVAHAFTNTDRDRVARMINVMTPGTGFDRYVAAALGGSGRSEMERLGREYGVTLVGPTLPEKLGLARIPPRPAAPEGGAPQGEGVGAASPGERGRTTTSASRSMRRTRFSRP